MLIVDFGRWLIDEGSRPIFERAELMKSDRSLAPPVEQRRIVAMPPVRSRSHDGRERSRARTPSPPREPHGYSYPDRERERSPYESMRLHPREIESRDKRGERYHSRGDDLRHELDQRRRDESVPHSRSSEFREGSRNFQRSRDSESDLRTRISEKRSDFRYEHEQDRGRVHHVLERPRSHHSPPVSLSRDRRGSPEVRPLRHEKRDMDRELWERAEREREREKERERDHGRKRRGRSREREDGRRGASGGSRTRSSVDRFPESSSERKDRSFGKSNDFSRPHELEAYEKEDFSASVRGRGGMSMRRPVVVAHPGPRGMPPRFRGPPVVVPIRPGPPFIPMRGGFRPPMPRAFSPRFGFFPPPFRPPFFM